MPDIVLLDPSETAKALSGHRFGSSEMLAKIATDLMKVLDSEASVYVSGLNDSQINALRTKMQRRSIRVIVRKVELDGKVGHVLLARSLGR